MISPISCLTCRSEAFKRGGRPGAQKVMIVITDGESHDSLQLPQAVADSERDNITMYAIAVSPSVFAFPKHPDSWFGLSEIFVCAAPPAGSRLLQPSGNQLGGLSEGNQVYCQRPGREALLQRDGRVGAKGYRGRTGRKDFLSGRSADAQHTRSLLIGQKFFAPPHRIPSTLTAVINVQYNTCFSHTVSN